SEGLVLRYLADAYRALRRTVPDQARTEELDDFVEWLGELVRQVDSSLLDEWEQLTHPDREAAEAATAPPDSVRPVTANHRAFRVMVRNALFCFVHAAARGDWSGLDTLFPLDWDRELEPYFAEYGDLDAGPDARGPQLIHVTPGPTEWTAR